MGALSTAPGVIQSAERIYVTVQDVMTIVGCKSNKAYQIIRDVNKHANACGYYGFPQGKANKYLFADRYNIPLDDVNATIKKNQEGG